MKGRSKLRAGCAPAVVFAALAVTALAPASSVAAGSWAGQFGSAIVYTAAPGQNNNLSITGAPAVPQLNISGYYMITDRSCAPSTTTCSIHYPIEARTPCTQVAYDQVRCPDNQGALQVLGNDGTDWIGASGVHRGVTIFGGTEDDFVGGGPGADHLYGQDGNDTIYGANGDDDEYGGIGNDSFSGLAIVTYGARDQGVDSFYGEAGNDHIFARDGFGDRIDCGSGSETHNNGWWVDNHDNARGAVFGCEGWHP